MEMEEELRPLWILEAPNQSGMAVATRHLAAGMAKIGRPPAIFSVKHGENAMDFEQIKTPVRVFPRLGLLFFGGSAARFAAGLGVNLVHALSSDMIPRAERLARHLGVPLLVTANRLEENEMRAMSAFRGHGVVAVSRAIRERIVNVAGVPQNTIRVIHNGLDLSRLPRPNFDALAAQGQSGAKLRTPVIGTFGHLSEKKGQRVFLQAVRLLVNKGLDAEFVILGDGPDRTALRSLADELNVAKRVTFTPQTVSGQLNQLDILVEPSLQEGLGVSVMQAMAMGVPVVATGVGGLYDLIEDGRTGLMARAGDPESLAGAIWRLLHNVPERVEMAKQAREMIEKEFAAEHVAASLVRYCDECRARFSGWGSRDNSSVRLYK